MKTCPFCQTQNLATAKFCSKCGTSLEGVAATGEATAPAVAMPPPPPPPPAPGFGQLPPLPSSPATLAPPTIPAEQGQAPGAVGRRYPGTVSATDILKESFAAVSGRRLQVWGIVGVYFLLSLALQLLGAIPVLGQIALLVLSPPLMLGLWKALLHFYDHGEADYGLLLKGFSAIGRSFGLMFVSLLAFIPVGVVFALSLMPMFMAMMSASKSGPGGPPPAMPGFTPAMGVGLLVMLPLGLAAGLVQMGFQLGYGLLADEPEVEFGDLIRRTWAMMSANWGPLMGYLTIAFLFAFATMLVIFYGWIMWTPVLVVMMSIFYRGVAEKTFYNQT